MMSHASFWFPIFCCFCSKFTQCWAAILRVCWCLFMFFIISCFSFSLCVCRPLCSAYYVQFHHVILNIIMCYVYKRSLQLWLYDGETATAEFPHSHCLRVPSSVCVYYKIVHEAADSRKTLHSIWSDFETMISSCKRTRIFRCVCFRLFVAICATALTFSYCLSMDGASISFENRMNDYKLAITYLFVIFCCCCKLTYSLEQSAHLLVSISSSSSSSSWSRIDAIFTLTHSLTRPLENSFSCILCAQTSFNS